MAADTKCEFSLARLKITVPEEYSIQEYKKLTETVLLYPGKIIKREKDNTYSIADETGNKISNVDIELIVKCSNKPQDTSISIDFYRLQGMPKRIQISEIVYCKPSTSETQSVGI